MLDEETLETALHWVAKFEVGAKTNQVTLTGANSFGLGVRFLKELDPLAQHMNSGNTPGRHAVRHECAALPEPSRWRTDRNHLAVRDPRMRRGRTRSVGPSRWCQRALLEVRSGRSAKVLPSARLAGVCKLWMKERLA